MANEKSLIPKQLSPLLSEKQLSEADVARGRGLAWLHVAPALPGEEGALAMKNAHELLQQAWDGGAQDAAVANGLAKIGSEIGWTDKAEEWAMKVCELEPLPTDERINSLAVLSEIRFSRGEYQSALDGFLELTDARRDARHWFYRGMAEQNLDRTDEAIESLRKSLSVDPLNPGPHTALAALYHVRKNGEREEFHRNLARKLAAFQQATAGRP